MIIVFIAIIVIIGVIEFLQYDGSTPIHYTIFGGDVHRQLFPQFFFPLLYVWDVLDSNGGHIQCIYSMDYDLIRTNEWIVGSWWGLKGLGWDRSG